MKSFLKKISLFGLIATLATPASAIDINQLPSGNPAQTSDVFMIERSDNITRQVTLGTAAFQPSTTFLSSANNLADLPSVTTARVNLGLGSAATFPSTAFLIATNNLSDLVSASTARTNLGLGSAAILNTSGVLLPANNLSDVSSLVSALTNILPSQTGQAGNYLSTNGTVASWAPVSGSGTVTTTGTPTTGNLTKFSGASAITNGDLSGDCATNGTLVITCTKTNSVAFATSATIDTTNASNIVSGTLGAARLPAPTSGSLGGTQSIAAVSHNFLTSISTSGVPTQAQPAATDISGLATSATTDTTNASNITSGTLAAARLPNPSASTLGGVQSTTGAAHNFLTNISTLGVPAFAQPAFTDISGSVAAAQLPNPTSSSLGGVQSYASVSNQWINSISTSGVPSSSQPSASNLSNGTTGTGAVVLAGSPTLVTPALGTPTSGIATNLTGTASGLTAGTVTTINGQVSAGSNIALSGSGTSSSPYVISGTPSGVSGQIQVNNSGSVGAVAGLGVYNVLDYGASCNGQTLTTATIASGTTVSNHTFTAGDVGKVVSISGGTNNVPTGTTTSGSATLTSISAYTGIVPGDYIFGTGIPSGTRVMVVNSGTNIIMTLPASSAHVAENITFVHILNTSIASLSGSNAVLATTTGTSLTGTAIMTFGTADDVGIQAAVTAATAAGGGLVKFPPSMCIPTASITVPTNVSFTGEGWGKSIVKPIYATDQSDGVFAGINNSATAANCTATLAATQLNNEFYNFEIDDSLATLASYNVSAKGIRVTCSTNEFVHHMYVHDTPATAVASDFGFNVLTHDNLLVNCGRLGAGQVGSSCIGNAALQNGGDTYSLTNNILINPTNYGIFNEGLSATTGTSRIIMTDNIVIGGPMSGTGTAGQSRTAGLGNSGTSNAVFSGNTIDATNIQSTSKWGGISTDSGTVVDVGGIQSIVTGNNMIKTYFGVDINYFASGAVPSGSQKANTVISGNHIDSATGYGVLLLPHTTGASMDGIDISDNVITNSSLCGVGIIGLSGTLTVNNVTLNSNIIANNGSGGSGYTQAGVCLNDVTLTGFRMIGNALYDNASGNQKYGIGINTGSSIAEALIKNNDFKNIATSPFDLLGTISGIVYDNAGVTATISGCSATGYVGGDSVGSYASGTSGSCAVTITPNGTSNITSPNGWVCDPHDLTTTADTQIQTASTTSSCIISGTTVSGDTVAFQARPF